MLPVTPSLGRQQQRILWASCLGGLAESGSAGLSKRFCLNRKGEKAGEMTQRVKEPTDRPVLEIWLAWPCSGLVHITRAAMGLITCPERQHSSHSFSLSGSCFLPTCSPLMFPFIHKWTHGQISCFGSCEQCSHKHGSANVFEHADSVSFGYVPRSKVVKSQGSFIFNFLRNLHTTIYNECHHERTILYTRRRDQYWLRMLQDQALSTKEIYLPQRDKGKE